MEFRSRGCNLLRKFAREYNSSIKTVDYPLRVDQYRRLWNEKKGSYAAKASRSIGDQTNGVRCPLRSFRLSQKKKELPMWKEEEEPEEAKTRDGENGKPMREIEN